MSKSLRELLNDRVHYGCTTSEEERERFKKLASEEFDYAQYCKGLDLARHVIYMQKNGEDITYPPLVEAELDENGVYRPKNTELNKGLFEGLGVYVANPSDIESGFRIDELNTDYTFETVTTKDELTLEEQIGLKNRVKNLPFLRVIEVS